MKIAWFTPWGPGSTAGDYSARVLATLDRSAEVTVFAPNAERRRAWWRRGRPVVRIGGIEPRDVAAQAARCDLAVYNWDSRAELHGDIRRIQQIHPGLVILHDLARTDLRAGGLANDEPSRAAVRQEGSTGQGDEGTRVQPVPGTWPAAHGALGVVVHDDGLRRLPHGILSVPVICLDDPSSCLPDGPFDGEGYCRRFLEFAEMCRSERAGLCLVDEVAQRLRGIVGPDPAHPLARRVAGELARMLGAA